MGTTKDTLIRCSRALVVSGLLGLGGFAIAATPVEAQTDPPTDPPTDPTDPSDDGGTDAGTDAGTDVGATTGGTDTGGSTDGLMAKTGSDSSWVLIALGAGAAGAATLRVARRH